MAGSKKEGRINNEGGKTGRKAGRKERQSNTEGMKEDVLRKRGRKEVGRISNCQFIC